MTFRSSFIWFITDNKKPKYSRNVSRKKIINVNFEDFQYFVTLTVDSGISVFGEVQSILNLIFIIWFRAPLWASSHIVSLSSMPDLAYVKHNKKKTIFIVIRFFGILKVNCDAHRHTTDEPQIGSWEVSTSWWCDGNCCDFFTQLICHRGNKVWTAEQISCGLLLK